MKEETIGTPTNKLYSLSSEPFDPEYQQNGSAYFSGKPSNVITPFGQRKEKFAVKFSVNQLPTEENEMEELDPDSEDDFLKKVKSKGRCSVVVHGTKPDLNCRFMYDRIEDKVLTFSLCVVILIFPLLTSIGFISFSFLVCVV